MGTYLFSPLFMHRYVTEGLLKRRTLLDHFNAYETKKLTPLPNTPRFLRGCLDPLMKSQSLWGLLHKAEKWLQQRFIIQDFCLPKERASSFIENSPLFPLWLCPIKSTQAPQLFSPHYSDHSAYFINVGMYGLPSHPISIPFLTKDLENKTREAGGRKVLYSYSTYSKEEFWQIYPLSSYQQLRMQTSSIGVWHDITDKVLSL